MTEDVFKVVDQNLSPVGLQLISQCSDEGGARRAGLCCQVWQQHLEGFLSKQGIEENATDNVHEDAASEFKQLRTVRKRWRSGKSNA